MCISLCGVELWNGLGEGLKQSANRGHFEEQCIKEEEVMWLRRTCVKG